MYDVDEKVKKTINMYALCFARYAFENMYKETAMQSLKVYATKIVCVW